MKEAATLLTPASRFYMLLKIVVETHQKMTGTQFLHMLSPDNTNRSEIATHQLYPSTFQPNFVSSAAGFTIIVTRAS